MSGVQFTMLGYPLTPSQGGAIPQAVAGAAAAKDMKVNHIVSFLTRTGGAIFKEKDITDSIDIVVVRLINT